MKPECRRFIIEQTIGSIILNAVLNGFGTWHFFASLRMESVPLFGKLSIFGDTLGTAFLLPFLVSITLTSMTHARMFGGLGRIDDLPGGHPLARLPAKPAARSAILGLICAVIFVPLLIGTLLALNVSQLDLITFCIAKATFTGVLAGLIAPMAVLRALTDSPAFALEKSSA